MRLFLFGSLHSSLFTFHFSLNASHDFSREKIRKKREENRKLCYAKRYSNTKNRFDEKSNRFLFWVIVVVGDIEKIVGGNFKKIANEVCNTATGDGE